MLNLYMNVNATILLCRLFIFSTLLLIPGCGRGEQPLFRLGGISPNRPNRPEVVILKPVSPSRLNIDQKYECIIEVKVSGVQDLPNSIVGLVCIGEKAVERHLFYPVSSSGHVYRLHFRAKAPRKLNRYRIDVAANYAYYGDELKTDKLDFLTFTSKGPAMEVVP